jgi:hypothetical protein
MTKEQERAATVLIVAVVAAAAFQVVAKQKAAALGMTAFELALLGGAASALVTRAVTS